MKYLKYCLLAMLCSMVNCEAQVPGKNKVALSVGDELPDIELTNLYNYPKRSLPLKLLRGKMIILDFWSIWCGSCIESFPKMQQLQREFGNRLQVLLVNTYEGDDIKKVKPFFAKRKIITGEEMTLPYSLNQSSLSQYFPFKYIPHYVWINQSGKLVAITSQLSVTKENIAAVLEGRQVNFRLKDDQLNFDYRKPLFKDGNGGTGNDFVYRSVITGYQEGLGNATGIVRDSNEQVNRFYALNISPLMLLTIAYPGKLNYSNNRIIVESLNKDRYSPFKEGDGQIYKHGYCYDLTIPPATMAELLLYVQQDLYRLLHVSVTSEEREMKTLVLNTGEHTNNLVTKGGQAVVDFSKVSKRNFIQNQPVSVLVDLLNGLSVMKATPVVAEGVFSKNVDLELPPGFFSMSIDSLKMFLRKAGFKVSEETRMLEVGVIKDGAASTTRR